MEIFLYGVCLLSGLVLGYVFLNSTIIKDLRSSLKSERDKIAELSEQNVRLKTLSEQSQNNLVTEFENLAVKILKQNSNDFTQLNQKEMEAIVKPLRERIFEFERKMEDIKNESSKNTVELKTHIEHLKVSSETLSEDAKNLTDALKGDNKIQGNWGELLLQRVLEASGLEKDIHYSTQDSFSQEGGRLQTDCIVKLPEDRNVVVDSKVSLVPLQNFYTAQSDEDKKVCLKELERSIKTHIEILGTKNYQDIEKIKAPDFVLMFMPVEGAFNMIFSEFDGLIDYAWKQRVLVVSPSTLMIALRTIALFWQQEKQTKNISEIVRVSGALYDKFVGLLDDLKSISVNLSRTQSSFDDAFKKIDGRGGLSSQVQKLQDLGAKTKKQIPQELLEVD